MKSLLVITVHETLGNLENTYEIFLGEIRHLVWAMTVEKSENWNALGNVRSTQGGILHGRSPPLHAEDPEIQSFSVTHLNMLRYNRFLQELSHGTLVY